MKGYLRMTLCQSRLKIINGLENKDHSVWTRSGDLVRGGFWTMAWEDLDLQRDLDALVRNGWIDENS